MGSFKIILSLVIGCFLLKYVFVVVNKLSYVCYQSITKKSSPLTYGFKLDMNRCLLNRSPGLLQCDFS